MVRWDEGGAISHDKAEEYWRHGATRFRYSILSLLLQRIGCMTMYLRIVENYTSILKIG